MDLPDELCKAGIQVAECAKPKHGYPNWFQVGADGFETTRVGVHTEATLLNAQVKQSVPRYRLLPRNFTDAVGSN